MSPKQKKILIAIVLLALPLTAYTSMVIVAFSHDAGPIETQAFERSRLFDKEKAERKLFDQRGLTLTCKTSVQQCLIEIQGTAVPVEQGQVVFKRPSDANDDFTVAWTAEHNELSAAMPLRGAWYVEFTGTISGDRVRARQQIFVP